MPLFTVDDNLCVRDGFCARVCPTSIIEMAAGDAGPVAVEGAETRCINCGHCVAVCPHAALSLERMPLEACLPLDADKVLGAGQAEQFLRSRRSIRCYRNKPVEREVLTRIIDMARYAPTGSNSQQVSWLVVDGREKLESLTGLAVGWMRHLVDEKDPMAERYGMRGIVQAWEGGIDIICRDAPALAVAHGPAVYPVMTIDCTIALTYLDLAASALGLGACWAGFFMIAAAHWPPLHEALDLPEGHKPFGAMMVGYPRHDYQRLPARKEASITWI